MFSDDGSLTLTFAPEPPPDTPESHWLPTPAGKAFAADPRLYLPAVEVRSSEWVPPPLQPLH